MFQKSAKNMHVAHKEFNWHAMESAAVLDVLDTSLEGLSARQAEQRLEAHGLNQLDTSQRQNILVRFLLQFHNILIYILLVAGLVTAALGHWIDSGVIFSVIIINSIIGVIQEGKAEKALDAIRNMLSHQAQVRRDNRIQHLEALSLVPGDIVQLQTGDKVPADLRLIKSRDLQIDESILTGESVPAEKTVTTVAAETNVADRSCMAYSGTLVTYGQATGVVVTTGEHTEVGKISQLLGSVSNVTTPLLRQIARFAKWLSLVIVLLALFTFGYGVWIQDYTATEMYLAAVGLAVAAIPEGLPAIMTITLAIGVQRMAQRNAIIRRLPAVETLGSVTVICSDKTGTLTRNEMTVQTVAAANAIYAVSGSGYDPHGEFTCDGQVFAVDDRPLLKELIRAGLLCNDAQIRQEQGQWRAYGDPTEAALVVLAMKAGMDPAFQYEEWPRQDTIPFESQHRFMATLHHDHAGHGFIYLKGAPEKVLGMCSLQRMHGEDILLDHAYWQDVMHQIADNGQRLLAIAFRSTEQGKTDLQFADVHEGLTLLGIVGIIDPPRQEAIEAVSRCRSAGIQVKMITGDHAITAKAIAQQINLADEVQVMSGHEIDECADDCLHQAVIDNNVFARASPEQKLRLVTALQANGNVIAMTGDGVNDAPALKRADVGVAMGLKGTEVAKEAAEMVLADDNFASITAAVEEGRTVYDNLKKAILFVLPTNGGEALTLLAAIALGKMLPITAVQILWVNMITAVTLALALAFEPAESNIMQRPPRQADEPILSGFLIWRIIFVSLILASGTFGLFLWERLQGTAIEEARTLAVNVLVMFEIFYLFNSRYLIASSFNLHALTGNRYALMAIAILLIFQMLFTYWAPLQVLFGTVDLGAFDWLRIVLIAASVFVLVEIEKLLWRARAR